MKDMDANQIKFSVAITTYNHEKYLAKALDSVFAQQHDYAFEVIISDDCSTDSTREIIASYQKKYPDIIKPIYQPKNIGVSKNCLQNFRSCKGEYIATLDGDDYWTDPNKIKLQISFLDKNPEYVLSCHRYKRFYDDTKNYSDDYYPELFENCQDGFDLEPEKYFEQWLTQTLTIVFRNNALDNTPQLEKYKYCWDAEIFWTVLRKGKGYIHNFFGGVYLIHSEGVWSKAKKEKNYLISYLIIEELYKDFNNDSNLKRIFGIYQDHLYWLCSENRKPLNVSKLNNTNFTIVSDDGWGEELYKAFDIPYLTPFIGINIFNSDFVKLVSDFEHFMKQPITFISVSESKFIDTFKNSYDRVYPIALLGEDIELHFTNYNSVEDAFQKWEERKAKIVWDNIFFKMDASREEENLKEIELFDHINVPRKICFLNNYDKKKILNSPFKDRIALIEYWNSNDEIFFPFSLFSFNPINWLNGGDGIIKNEDMFDRNIFGVAQKRNDYFLKIDSTKTILFQSVLFPKEYNFEYNPITDSVLVKYEKLDLEYFTLPTIDKSLSKKYELFIDLSNEKDQHMFILMKGSEGDQINPELLCKDENQIDHGINTKVYANFSGDMQWIHFDLSTLSLIERNKILLSEVRSFMFFVSPKSEAKGSLEIAAFFVGEVEKFNKLIIDKQSLPGNDNLLFPIKRDHYFIKFESGTFDIVDNKLFPDNYGTDFTDESESLLINCNKSDQENFIFKVKDHLLWDKIPLFIDLSFSKNRHLMILMKGDKDILLNLGLICKAKNDQNFTIDTKLIANVSDQYEWIHFDFSLLETEGAVNYLFSRIVGFSFIPEPGEEYNGEIEIIAFFAGSLEKFEEILS